MKKQQPKKEKKTKLPSDNVFDKLVGVKKKDPSKTKTDYGLVTINALRRANFD